MELWQPDPGETLLARAPISFATGAAAPVSGMRWFRDTARKDIQNDLEGWPPGPLYEARSVTGSATRQILRGAIVATGMAIGTFLSMHGGRINGTPGSNPGTDAPEDRADEVDDFPVMWAAPGTVARTLPWQLDPARARANGCRTHAVVTDRRLVVVGFDYIKGAHDFIHDDFLWEVPRSAIAKVELRNFKTGLDAKIVFTDDSWCRVSSRARERLTRYLIEPLEFIPLHSLSPVQRKTAEDFAARQGPDAHAPLVKRNSCGCFRIEVLAPSKTDVRFGHPGLNSLMDDNGTEIPITKYHPQDFLT